MGQPPREVFPGKGTGVILAEVSVLEGRGQAVGNVVEKMDHVVEEMRHVVEEVDHVVEEVGHVVEEVDHVVEEVLNVVVMEQGRNAHNDEYFLEEIINDCYQDHTMVL